MGGRGVRPRVVLEEVMLGKGVQNFRAMYMEHSSGMVSHDYELRRQAGAEAYNLRSPPSIDNSPKSTRGQPGYERGKTMSDDAPESLELSPYERFNTFFMVFTAILPSMLCLAIYSGSGESFWLFGFFLIGGGGFLNLYLFKVARSIPQKVRLDAQGIAFTTKAGSELSFLWSEVDRVRDHIRGRRYKHHVEIRFKESKEILRLYRTSLRISEHDGRAVDNELEDTMIGTIITWDRPVELSRLIIARHVPGFEA
tara:strand:+ start:631 stop:1392 length:762 start_codon:yes stop_codon:yes gene_type:complete